MADMNTYAEFNIKEELYLGTITEKDLKDPEKLKNIKSKYINNYIASLANKVYSKRYKEEIEAVLSEADIISLKNTSPWLLEYTTSLAKS